MTTNQIRFAELREAKRHNLETEGQGRRKIQYDYEVGSRQAGASESHAAAAHRSATAAQMSAGAAQVSAGAAARSVGVNAQNARTNAINAATRQGELDFAKYQYENSGRALEKSQASRNYADAGLTGSKQFAQDYQNSKTKAFGYWTIDTMGDMIGNLPVGALITMSDLK